MKVDLTIDDIFPDAALRAALKQILSGDDDFASIANNLNLDKSADFRNSNLSRVDFSYADLRGFDFTGSDLRRSYGLDIEVDETTTFDRCDLAGSIFEKYVGERTFFESTPDASRLYHLLKSGDTYEVSDWIASRSGHLGGAQLKGLDEKSASILCQKLIVDEVDLTKRTTLFYNLRRFTNSEDDMRRVVADFVAFHLNDSSVIRAFIKVAANILSKDEFVAKTLLMLCGHRDERVREAAFGAISTTGLFIRNFRSIYQLFLLDKNTAIRKSYLLETASQLSKDHVLSINTEGKSSEIEASSVLDFGDLLTHESNFLVRASQSKRASQQSSREIMERQQEVLAVAPVFSKILKVQNVNWMDAAQSRTQKRYDDLYRHIAAKIDHGFRRTMS
jgi:hypothetical protein